MSHPGISKIKRGDYKLELSLSVGQQSSVVKFLKFYLLRI